ncbi:hypothetical protein [Xenorhabdus griffiniae]|uniref:Uncharacterized protein n=1 Tax=Xenorhabdus griffiniae TaxID=351672 RepID=A0ABY9XJD0_9GAMM|nr:hypothetical protein [Xenorhabdus griffiniae]MBD1226880.1 hypothetical protein [Xenorhabdus griffiniae]MBE8586243.1 hypothetical protein [Xenorhabdus griffiniae]WMV73006.1 hypothetical protein QL128_02820 [Xenorhabdus griffiniae]WNH02685.1 hypothetical protein QL112_002825 [Xenorhabdus griffiniae]
MFTQKRNIRIEVTKDKTLDDLKGLSAEEAIKVIETAQAIRVVYAEENNSPKS